MWSLFPLEKFKSVNDGPGDVAHPSCCKRRVVTHAAASGPETQVATPQSHQAHSHQHGSGILLSLDDSQPSCRAQLHMCIWADAAAAPGALLRMSTLARQRRPTPPTTVLRTRRCATAKPRQTKNQSGTKAVHCRARHRMERASARHRSDCALPIAKPRRQMQIGAIRI